MKTLLILLLTVVSLSAEDVRKVRTDIRVVGTARVDLSPIHQWADAVFMHVPLLNKIYGATKQVNDALVTGNKNSFKTVVLIEFPHPGSYSMGFLTSEDAEIRVNPGQKMVCVFVPTTPNPTSGFLMLVPDEKVTRLKMSVAEGLKYIISLGAIAPEFPAQTR